MRMTLTGVTKALGAIVASIILGVSHTFSPFVWFVLFFISVDLLTHAYSDTSHVKKALKILASVITSSLPVYLAGQIPKLWGVHDWLQYFVFAIGLTYILQYLFSLPGMLRFLFKVVHMKLPNILANDIKKVETITEEDLMTLYNIVHEHNVHASGTTPSGSGGVQHGA